ncbi:MAG TPA: head GIN domain-containing protein [Puia sp.]|nr:head GIN domain-containing protein [Puia sp.]
MKKLILFSLGMLIASMIWAQKNVITDPNAEVRPNLNGFHAIEVSNAIDLYLSQGNEETVAVSAKDVKYRDRIRTEVKNGVLKIWYDNNGWKWDNGNKKMKAYVSFKTLDRLNASGASDVAVDGTISGDRLDIGLSGASDFKGAVNVKELHMDQSGASDVTISGTATTLTIQASGASDVKGYNLVVDNCDAHASGASDIRVSVNKELNAHASGASSIYYRGTAVIRELHSNGASSVGKED